MPTPEWLNSEICFEALETPIFHDEDRGPALVFSDGTESIFTADMSGDGLTVLPQLFEPVAKVDFALKFTLQ